MRRSWGTADEILLQAVRRGAANPDQAFPQLTTREREVLTLIAQHVTNPEIATRLELTLKAVSNHVFNIFSTPQVADRAQAIILARDAGPSSFPFRANSQWPGRPADLVFREIGR